MTDTDTIPVPGPDGLNERCRTALEYAASVIEQEKGTNNGVTALYWHLHSVVMQHVRRSDD